MRWRIRMQVQIEELPEALDGETGGEGEIVPAGEGVYEQILCERTSESIDEMAAVLHRMQFEVGRHALAQHLSGVAKKKPAELPRQGPPQGRGS